MNKYKYMTILKIGKSEIMLCIYDSVYSEIYLKDRFLLEKIYNSLDEKNFNPIYITEKNIRNKISVF